MKCYSFGMISKPRTQGFSLLEVLITAAIIGIVTAIVVVRYGAFNNSVLLKSQAYEMALDIREAQVFAVSVRPGSGSFRDQYGMYFDESSPGEYVLFVDSNDNNMYDSGTDTVINRYLLDSRFFISDLTVDGSSQSSVSVVFRRPDFDAMINDDPANETLSTTIQSTGSSETRLVTVTNVGQITVE